MKIIKQSLRVSLALAGVLFLFQSCKKVEGQGGSSSIVGKVHVEVYNNSGDLTSEYDAPDEDVYLIYGDEDGFYDDDVKTSYDGSFEFNYLQKGTYKLFVYQDCDNCASGKEPVFLEVEITDNKTTVEAGTLTIID